MGIFSCFGCGTSDQEKPEPQTKQNNAAATSPQVKTSEPDAAPATTDAEKTQLPQRSAASTAAEGAAATTTEAGNVPGTALESKNATISPDAVVSEQTPGTTVPNNVTQDAQNTGEPSSTVPSDPPADLARAPEESFGSHHLITDDKIQRHASYEPGQNNGGSSPDPSATEEDRWFET